MPSTTREKSASSGNAVLPLPLSPDLLTRLGKLPPLPLQPVDLNGTGSTLYRYDVCGGWASPKLNPTLGWLRLSRSVDDLSVTLLVEDHLQFEGSQQHRMATIRYCKEGLPRPTDWKLDVQYFDKDGRERAELRLSQQGVAAQRTIRVNGNGKSSSFASADDLACGWGLLDAVQRLPMDPSVTHRFSLFDHLQTIKPNHRITYAGKSKQPWGDNQDELHQFRQFGTGIGPTEYWLNTNGHLVLVTSMTLACIYDPSAIEKANEARAAVQRFE